MSLLSQKMKKPLPVRVLPWLFGLMVMVVSHAPLLVAQSDVESGDVVVPSDQATGWNTYRHDNRRSGVTSSSLNFPLNSK